VSKLEDLQPGLRLAGVIPGPTVAVIAVQPHGADTVELTYKAAEGGLGQRVLGRDAEPKLAVAQTEARPLDAPAADFKLVAECQRIKLAGLWDPMLAVTTSAIQPLPHQLRAVYGELLPRTPLRFLLADDPGAGKTIMAGLYMDLREQLRVRQRFTFVAVALRPRTRGIAGVRRGRRRHHLKQHPCSVITHVARPRASARPQTLRAHWCCKRAVTSGVRDGSVSARRADGDKYKPLHLARLLSEVRDGLTVLAGVCDRLATPGARLGDRAGAQYVTGPVDGHAQLPGDAGNAVQHVAGGRRAGVDCDATPPALP
jgi:hypothetical protein